MAGDAHAAHTGRRVGARALLVIGSITLTISLLVGWTQRTVFTADEFARRTISVLDSATVRHELSEQIADQVVQNGKSSLASYRAEIVGIADDVLTTDGFRVIFHNALVQAHRAVFQRNAAAAVLELGETLQLLSEHASTTNTSLAAKLPSATSSLLINVTPTLKRLELWRFANDLHWLDEVALAATAIAFAGALLLDRRRGTFVGLGVALAAAGAAVVLVTEIIPDVAANTIKDPAEADAIRAAVSRFIADLKAVGLWTIPFGVILAAAAEASARSDRIRVASWLSRMRERRYADLSWTAQLGVGVVTLVAGLAILYFRQQVVPLLLLVGGFFIVYLGTVLVIRALLGPEPEPTDATETASRLPRRVVVSTIGAVVGVLLLGGLLTNVAAASDDARDSSVLLCNGSEDLCDRRLNQVAFAGSHNSMSAQSDPGWVTAENRNGIPAQLEYGVRALLVKSHYGIATGVELAGAELVVTDKEAEINSDRDAEAEELGTEAVQTVERTKAEVGPISGKPEIYLCHGYCELGATRFADTLTAVRAFMNRNPHDVLIMIIGDFVTPADTAAAFKQAGLLDRVWTYDRNRPPPTLRKMIDARRTLMVLAEHSGGDPAWYNSAYLGDNSVFQDTPFTFADPSEFSCAQNRGASDSPLFQINHWITNKSAPSAVQAESVNSSKTLMAAAKECERERQQFPTIIGVNFYSEGDLLKVVDRLNRTGP